MLVKKSLLVTCDKSLETGQNPNALMATGLPVLSCNANLAQIFGIVQRPGHSIHFMRFGYEIFVQRLTD